MKKRYTVCTDLFDGLEEESKVCSKCNNNLPLYKYGTASGGKYLRSECRDCEKELNVVRAALKSTAPAIPENYICPICNKTESELLGVGGKKSGVWCCDHDHVTETFRGWICHNCNRGLGAFKDNPALIKSALDYLKKAKNEIPI